MFKNYIQLMKPRITILVIVTSYLGFYLGIRSMNQYLFTIEQLFLLFNLLLGTFLTASGSAVLNQVIEYEHDAKMKRTKLRPIPSGKISLKSAMYFGIIISTFGVIYLYIFTNFLTAILSLLTIILYLFVYTPSKRVSTWNTVIGSIPGSISTTWWLGSFYRKLISSSLDFVWYFIFLANPSFYGNCYNL